MRKIDVANKVNDVLERELPAIRAEMKGLSYALRKMLTPHDMGLWHVDPRFSLSAIRGILQGDRVDGGPEALQDFLLPLSGVRTESVVAKFGLRAKTKNVGACDEAEGYFVDALSQIRTNRDYKQTVLRVFHDPDGAPLFLRKCHKSLTSLSLGAIEVGEFGAIPAGSIVFVQGGERTGRVGYRHTILETFCIDPTDTEISPQRMSPWAYDDPLDRALYAVEWVPPMGDAHETLIIDAKRMNLVASRSIEDFRQVAGQVMQLCGATT